MMQPLATQQGAEDKPRCIGDTVGPMAARQRSRQQLIVCWLLWQHESCEASDWAVGAV